jgi:hypothetical protein
MKNVYNIMIKNEKFNQITDDLIDTYYQNNIQTQEQQLDQSEKLEKLEQVRHLVLLILFSQDIFYIMHKCICQQIEQCTIDDDLLVTLKQKCIEIILSLNIK